MKGKEKCDLLNEIRQKIADENNIDFHIEKCTFEGDCTGTCPKCESELEYLEKELEKKQKAGENIKLTNVFKFDENETQIECQSDEIDLDRDISNQDEFALLGVLDEDPGNEVENLRRARLAKTRNEADFQIYSAQKLIYDSKNQLNSRIINHISTLISELMKLKDSDDERFIKSKTNELRYVVEDVSSSILDRGKLLGDLIAEPDEVENLRMARLAEVRNEADSQIYSAQNLIDDPDVKNQLDAETLDYIVKLISELLELKESEDENSIIYKTKELHHMVEEVSSSI